MNILFICKHNRFRSKVAEYLFRKYNSDKKIKADSAGIKPDYLPVSPIVRKVLRRFGVKRINIYPKKITKNLIKSADLIVLVADNVNLRIKGKKIIRWNISDTSQDNYKGIFNRVKIIKKRIKSLIKRI